MVSRILASWNPLEDWLRHNQAASDGGMMAVHLMGTPDLSTLRSARLGATLCRRARAARATTKPPVGRRGGPSVARRDEPGHLGPNPWIAPDRV